MYNSTKAIGYDTIYIRLRDFGDGTCPFCKSEAVEIYPDSGHSFLSLDGWKNAINYWYRCTNPNCPSGGKFKAPQPYVLPYKKFGQDVWVFVCAEWERYKTNPNEIKKRLSYKGVYISEDVISQILEDFKLLKDQGINDKTFEVVKKQGRIIIGCDGTPTESGCDSLWTFYDVISGRMLYATFLHHSDHKTLYNIFCKIKKQYIVPITCFLSDHQPSIFKATKMFDPTIPHQTCHYHFLRNHWVFLEDKDIHMNKELRKMVNGLSIGKSENNEGTYYSEKIKVEKREFFEPLHRHLKKCVNYKKDEFKSLKGMNAYESLTEIVDSIENELETLNAELRPTIQLRSLKEKINQKLIELASTYFELKELMGLFQLIRKILEHPKLEKNEKIECLEEIYSKLFIQNKAEHGYQTRTDIKSIASKYDHINSKIYCLWTRLWDSHKEHLFYYYDVEDLEKTNIYNEQMFSILKRLVVKAHGRAHKNYMVLTRGTIYLTDICDKDSKNIQEILTQYDLKHLTQLRQPLQQRIDNERAYFRNSKVLSESVHEVAKNIREKSWEL